MGAKQSAHTKNTFINLDTRDVDGDFTTDTRLTKSWHSPSTVSPFDLLLQEETSQFEALGDDWTPRAICRLKTVDPFDAQVLTDYCGTSDASSSLSSSPAFGEDRIHREEAPNLPQLNLSPYTTYSESLQASAPGGPVPSVVLMQMPAALPTMGAGQVPMMWAWSPTLAPASSPVEQLQGNTFMEQLTPAALPERYHGSALQPRAEMEQRRLLSSRAVSKDGRSTWTCRMIRNLPNDYTRQDLVDLLDSKGVQYNFIYLPIDWRKYANLGYAFVNLTSHEEAKRIEVSLNGFSDWKFSSEKVCEVVWGKAEQQNLDKNIERFRNSPVMHPDVPDKFKPLLFAKGQRVVFPAPTRQLQPPRGFNARC